MTTPERLRRRQYFESVFIAILAIALVAAFVYFQGRASAQQRCVSTFISTSSDTAAIRSSLVERESMATRRIILDGTKSTTREEFSRVRARYVRTLRAIDKARADNPVAQLPKGVCD